jgi:rare lipoprotein A
MAHTIYSFFATFLTFSVLSLTVCSAPALSSPVHKIEKMFNGVASFYADKFNGKKTASGDIFDNSKLTCAHRTLPFGTPILIKNPDTGSVCEVIVNDRGPYAHNRVVDLSKAAAKKLGITGLGKVVCYAGKHIKDAIDIDFNMPGIAVASKHDASRNQVASRDTSRVIVSSQTTTETVVQPTAPAVDRDIIADAAKTRAD